MYVCIMYDCMYTIFNENYRTNITVFSAPCLQIKVENESKD